MRLLDELFAAGWGRGRQGIKAADDAGAVRGGRRNRRASRVGRQAQFEALEQRKMLAVLISQYVETNSGTTPKGIELWNPTASDITFTAGNALTIEQGTNGGTPATLVTINSGSLPAGGVLVVGTTDMSPDVIRAFNFNGDDALVVKLAGVVTDVFGTPGVDPGTAWTGGGVSTANQNIQLKEGITTGNTVGWTDPSLRFETVSTTPATLPAGLAGFGLAPGVVDTSPAIAAPISAAALSAVEGTASGSTTVAVSGANLTAGILATAPAGFEVSLDDAIFAESVTIPQVGGSASATLYVRIAASAAPGAVSGNLALSSAGATAAAVALSGSVRAATVPFPYALQTFEDTVSAPWFTYDAALSTNNWTFRSSTFGGGLTSSGSTNQVWEMNGFTTAPDAVPADDWLIIGAFDFSTASNPVAEFSTLTRFAAASPELSFKYSTDYSGVGNPALATWTQVPFTPASSQLIKSPSGQVLLADVAGQSGVYLAFHYVAGGTGSGQTAVWQVDDFQLYNAQTLSLSIAGLPATLNEGDYDIRGTVSIPAPIATNVTVTLTSSDDTELVLDSGDLNTSGTITVTIAAGQTAAEFFVEALEDGEVDEDIAVTITASVGDASYDSATASVTVVNIDATPAPLTAEGYTQTFATFAAATPDLPLGWSGRGLVTAFNADTSSQVWGQGFSSGYRGGANLFGYQHTGSTSTTASPNFDKVLTLRNDTGDTISDLTVAYTGRVERVNETRPPAYTVTVAGSTVEALAYSTGEGVDAARSVSLSSLSIAPGEIFQIVWSSERGGPSGSSRQIGLSDVSVTLGLVQTAPTVSGLSVSTVTLGRESADAIATIASDGGDPLSAAGFVYIATADLTGELTLATAGAVNVPEAAAFVGQISETLSGLTAGTPYTIRAYATNAIGTAYSAAQSFTTLSAPASFAGLYTQDFATYQGLLPVGWSAGTSNEINGYLGEWGSGSSAGFLGVGATETTGVLGYQHTTTSGQLSVTLTLVNDTGAVITELDVGYVGRVARPTQTRTPEWTVSVAGSPVAELGYSTGNTAGDGGTAIDQAVANSLTGLSIAAGAEFTITWTSINEAGAGGQSGASRQIGITDVSVALPGVAVPSITVTGSLASFTTVSGTPSAAESVIVTGADLQGDITATAPAGFEVSGDGVAFAATATFPAPSGTVLGSLYVRVAAAAAAGSLTGNVQLTSASATRVDVPVAATVAAAPLSLPYGPENFEAGFTTSIAPWFTYSVAGNRNWGVVTSTLGGGSNRTFQINGFGGDVPANDWLILGEFDFSDATNPAISFSTLNDFTANGAVVNELTLKVSTDYAGAGDPSLATWTEIPFNKPAAEEVKTASLQVPLTDTASEPSVYVAFHYVAGGTASGETALWQVDDVSVADVTSPALAITTAASLTETDYDVVGTISIPTALGTDLVVTLTSSDAGELLVYNDVSSPAASTVVTIIAGQTSGQFFMEGVPDGEVDGDIAVTLTATAAGYTAAETTVTVVNLDLPGADLTTNGYTQEFASFTTAETLPLGWSLTATNSTYTAWAANDTGAKFGSATVDVFGYQHIGSTGVVQQVLTLVNATGSTVTDLTVAFDGRVARASESRTPSYSVFVGGFVVPGLAYSTADGDDVRRQASISGLSIGAGEKFSIVWESDGSTTGSPGSGNRRQIGIGDVSVTLGVADTTPSIGSLAVPSATLGRDSAGLKATITSDGGATVSAAGFVVIATADLVGELTLATAGATIVSVDSPAVGEIIGTLSGLSAETGYTVRAYATNAEGTAYAGPLAFTTISSAASLANVYTQDFATFTGTLPEGWSLASTGEVLGYAGDWGSGSTGGLRGVGQATVGGVLGYQHTSGTGTFTVSLALVNNTGDTIESLDVSYLGRVARADQGRIPEWTVSIDGVATPSLAYSTNNTAGEAGVAGDQTIAATITGLAIGVGEIFTISWASERGDQSGSSRQIGIGDVSVGVGGSQPATPTITPTGVPTTDSLRIVTYNITASQGSGQPRSGLDTILAAISSETFAGRTDRIDVLALQEVQSQTTTTAAVVSLLNGLYGGGTYARGSLNGSGLYTVGVVYDTTALSLVEEVAVTTGGPRQTIRYRFEPAAGSAADGFYLYNSHLKASSDSTSESTRAAEATAIRANADALGAGVSVLYVGDFNLYTSNEVAFQTFVGAGNGQAFDPINSSGNWSGSSSFRGIFTQSPSSTGSGELVGGGLDDRFDFQLVSGEVLDGSGFDYLPNSYRAFGNNGSVPVNGSINSGSNTALAGLSNRLQVLDLLTTVSDHLPVVADYTMPTSQGLTALSTTAGTASAASSFVVSAADLAGDLTISAPVGFELSLSESSGYTAAGLVLSPVSGMVAATTIYIRLAATATAGSYTGNVSFASAGAQTQTLAIPTSTVTGDPDPVAPVSVKGAYVKGSAWNASYLARSPFTTLDGSAIGWQLPDGANQLVNASNVSWNNVDVVSVRFDQPIAQPAADALQLVLGTAGGNQMIVPSVSPTLLAGGTVAQWTLPAAIASGRYVISIASAGITNAAGTAVLDGEWTSSTSTFAEGSGDGTAGGIFNFFFNALVGDVNGNGSMNPTDISTIRSSLTSAFTTSLKLDDSDYRLDINGSNGLNSADLSQTRAQLISAFGTSLASLPSVTAPVEQSVRSVRGFASLVDESGTNSNDPLSAEAWAWYALSVESETSKKTQGQL